MRAKVLLALVSVALTVVTLEVVLTRFAPQRTLNHVLANHAAMYRQSDAELTELIPNFAGRDRAHEGEFDTAVRINSLGYRQAEFDSEKGARTRLVAIGDSFTFGHGVEGEEAWPRVLEHLLAGQASQPIEVINAGVDARWVDEYYLELKRRSLALAPDVVIVGFFVGNDIDGEDARTHVWRAVDERGRPLTVDAPDRAVEHGYRVQRPPQLRWRYPVLRNSQVAQLLFGAWKAISELWEPPENNEVKIFAPVYEPQTERVVERVEDLFVAMADLCRTHGARLLVVMIPTREQVSPELRSAADGRDWEKPQRVFATFFAQRGISFIDLLPALRAATAGSRVYFRFDAHWTATGHVVAARAIAEHLERNGFLAAAPVVTGAATTP